MDFAAMKRRELQALCKRHGLAGGGTNADLVARLTATLTGSAGAAEEAVGVVVGKGCLKRSAGGASGGDSDAAKKVTFELEEDEEAEVGVTGRGRRRSQVLSSPAAAKTRGRQKAGEVPPAAKGNGGERRRTRSQAGGYSADESDSGEAGAVAPVRRPGRNAVNLGARDEAERVTPKIPAKAEQEEVDVGDAVGRKHQLKRKTRENDIEDVDVSGQVGASRRSTRSSSHLVEPDALSSRVEKKRGRRKAADVKAHVEEQPTEALHSGRTLRSGVVVVAPVPPIVSESKKSRWKVQEEEPAVEKVAKVEISGRATRSSSVAPAVVQKEEPAAEKVAKVEISGRATRSSSVAPAVVQEEEPAVEKVAKVEISGRATRSSSVAPAVTTPRVIAKKRGRKTDDLHSDEGPDKKMENQRQSSRLTTRSSIHHLNSSGNEASLEQVAAPSKGLPPRRSRRSPSEANMMLNSNTTSESSNQSRAPTEFNGPKIARPTMLNAAKDGVEDGVEKLDKHVGLKKSKPRNVSATVSTNGGEIASSDSSGKISATDVQIEVPGPVRRSTRKSVVPSSLELETNAMHKDIEKKQTVTKPVGRSTRRSVAPDILFEKESKGLTKETVSEAHVKRPTRKSVVPAMLEKGRKGIITEIIPEAPVKKSTRKRALPMVNSENNDQSVVVSSENHQSDKSEELEKQPTVKQPVRRVTRKSAVPATPEKDRKGVPDMLNNENGDRTEMQSDKVGNLEKLVVKESVRRPTGKSVVPDVIEKEKTNSQEELKSEVSVRTPVCKSGVPNVINKDSKDHNEFVRREEVSVKTRSAHTRLQVALQNDESLRRTTRKSSKLAIPPPQSKPTASKGRPAKRRRTSSLQEDMPAEEQKEDQIAEGAHMNDVIEVATSTDLEIGMLPFAAEKSDLQDSQLSSELEGMVVVEPGFARDEDNSERLEIESEDAAGTTEKPPSNLPILDCNDVVALSEEAVNSIENDGRCSPNFEQSPGLQFLSSQGFAERSATQNAIPCPQNSVEQSDVHEVECRVETVVSSKHDSYQGSDENSAGVEESGGLMFSSQQNSEQEVFSVSSHQKDLVVSAQLDPTEDVDHVVRDVTTDDLICKEEEKKDLIPSSDINVPHEISLENEPAENASGVSGAVFCISQRTPISDNKPPMEQVQQDDVQVLEGTLENTALGSATPESNQQFGLFEEAEPHSLKSAICSSSVEHSPFGLQSLFWQDDAHVQEGTLEKAALDSVTPGLPDEAEPHSSRNERCSTSVEQSPFCLQPLFSQESEEEPSENVHAKNGVDESKDIHVGYGVEKPPLPESVSDHDSNVDFSAVYKSEDCAYTSDQGLTNSCHEQEQMTCQLDMLEAANCMKDFTYPEAVSYVEENKKSVHSTEINSSCENLYANGPVKHASGLGDGLLSSSLTASADGTDVYPGSNLDQFESTDFLDESRGCPSTEALQQGLKELCDEPKEYQVTGGPCPRDVIESDTVKDLVSEVPPLPAEETSNFLGQSSQGSDMHGDLVLPIGANEDDSNTCHVEQQVENMISSEPDSSKGSDMHGDLVLPSAENEDDSITCHVKLQVEKMVSSEPDSHQGSHEDLDIVEGIRDRIFSSQLENEKDEQLIAPMLSAETPALPDEPANPELEAGESEKCSFSSEDTSGKIDTGHMKNNLSQLHKDSHMDPIQGKELPSDLPAPKSPEQSAAGQDVSLPDGQPNPELKGGELKEHKSSEDAGVILYTQYVKTNLDQLHEDSPTDPNRGEELPDDVPARKSPAQSTVGQDAEISASPDEQPSPELDLSEFAEPNLSHIDPNQGKELPDDVPAPKSPAQPTIGQNAEPSALPDEQPSPELDSSEFEERKLSHMDPKQGKGLPDDVPASKSPAQSTIGQDAETPASPDEQPNPELDSSEIEEQNLRHMDPNQGKELPDDVPAPISPAQLPDEQPSPELDTSECEEQNLSHMDPNQGKKLPDGVAAPKSPATSTIGQDAKTPVSPDELPNPELDLSEIEEQNLRHMDPNQGKELPDDVPAPISPAQLPDEQPSPELDTSECEEQNLSHMDPNQGKKLPDGVAAPKSPATSTIGQDAKTPVSPDELPNPELDSSEFEEQNLPHMDLNQGKDLPDDVPGPKSPAQSTVGQDAETPASPDEQPNPELDSSEFEEQNLPHMDLNQGKDLPDDVPAPKSPAQSTVGQDAETPASPDEQPNPELDSSEFEEQDLSIEDTSDLFGVKTTPFQFHEDSHIDSNQGKELPDDIPASKSHAQSTIGQDGEISASPDEQPNPELDLSEFEERLSQFHGDSHMDPIQGKGLPNDLPAPKFPEQSTFGKDAERSAWSDEQLNPELEVGEYGEGNFDSEDTSGIFGTEYGLDNLFEEYNDAHDDDQAAAALLSSGMTKPTLIEGSGCGMAPLSAAGTPALTDEQLNSKLEGSEEHIFCFDADNSYISATGLVGNPNLSSLPEDTCMETCFEQGLPIGTPAAKSSRESAVFGDNSVPGSAGTCQTSGRRRVDEISKKLLSFKISSAVKGSYIAMDSAKAKQGGNPSRISVLGNTENVPATNPDDPAEINPDWLDVKESPRQGTTDGL